MTPNCFNLKPLQFAAIIVFVQKYTDSSHFSVIWQQTFEFFAKEEKGK